MNTFEVTTPEGKKYTCTGYAEVSALVGIRVTSLRAFRDKIKSEEGHTTLKGFIIRQIDIKPKPMTVGDLVSVAEAADVEWIPERDTGTIATVKDLGSLVIASFRSGIEYWKP